MQAHELKGGLIIVGCGMMGIGVGHRYRLERDGREHFALRKGDGARLRRRYTPQILEKALQLGLIAIEHPTATTT